MKILSYNISGVGSRAKRREIRELNSFLKSEVCCIQESKKEVVKEGLCKALWGNRGILK